MFEKEDLHIISIDLETTGIRVPSPSVNYCDEILQLAIVDHSYSVVLNEYYRPEFISNWPEAEQINGITPSFVKAKPFFSDRYQAIQKLLDQFDLYIFYNANFDLAFLMHQGIQLEDRSYFCIMQAYSRLRAKRSPISGNYRMYSLEHCARYFGIPYQGRAHDASVDAITTLMCFDKMNEQLHIANLGEG